MSVQATLIFYCVLMVSLALLVRLERLRRRKGPTLKPGHLNQLKGTGFSGDRE
jgi:hypothetical protein